MQVCITVIGLIIAGIILDVRTETKSMHDDVLVLKTEQVNMKANLQNYHQECLSEIRAFKTGKPMTSGAEVLMNHSN